MKKCISFLVLLYSLLIFSTVHQIEHNQFDAVVQDVENLSISVPDTLPIDDDLKGKVIYSIGILFSTLLVIQLANQLYLLIRCTRIYRLLKSRYYHSNYVDALL
ncbi:hypothetical protein [Bacillus sp. AK128]